MKVYKRTSEGQWAAFDEHSPLPRKLKILLKAVNGKVAEDVYVKNLGAFGDVRSLLLSLEHAGLIADRGRRSSKASAVPDQATAQDATVVIPQLDAVVRRPSPVQWQELPVLNEAPQAQAQAPQTPPTPPTPQAPLPAPIPAEAPAQPVAKVPGLALAESLANSPARQAAYAELLRQPPVLTEVHAAAHAGAMAEVDALAALADLAELAGQSAMVANAAQASNLITHNALLAANDEPITDAASKRGAVRHAVEIMSNFVLAQMPRTASQVLPEIESLHSVEQWAELMDGYAMFIAPTGERGQTHLREVRRLLNAALNAADMGSSSKGWYA